jgi:ATP-dependent RNA helicase DDX51/DBP6
MFNTNDNQSDTVRIKSNINDAIHYNEEQKSPNTKTKLENPIQSYSLPPKLSEYMIECKSEQKPLVLLALLLEQQQSNTSSHKQGIIAVFTSSIDSTHRLARLLQLLWVGAGYGPSHEIAEFSSNMTQKQRAALIQSCNSVHSSLVHEKGSKTKPQSRIKIVICSDGMSRGMDIASISTVIHYDIPSYAKTYVHRCGRTARANREGQAISILKVGQKSQFTKMRNLITNPEQVEMMGVKKDLVQGLISVYQKCVKALRNVMEAEKNEELSPFASVDVSWLK